VLFTPRSDGSGLYCSDDANALGGKIGAICKGYQPAPATPASIARQLASACADKPFYGAGKKKRKRWQRRRSGFERR
jgi:hypothetical protein